jgi:hypothetical protein
MPAVSDARRGLQRRAYWSGNPISACCSPTSLLPGGMTGRQLAEEARTMRPHLKILFTTGYAQRDRPQWTARCRRAVDHQTIQSYGSRNARAGRPRRKARIGRRPLRFGTSAGGAEIS